MDCFGGKFAEQGWLAVMFASVLGTKQIKMHVISPKAVVFVQEVGVLNCCLFLMSTIRPEDSSVCFTHKAMTQRAGSQLSGSVRGVGMNLQS